MTDESQKRIYLDRFIADESSRRWTATMIVSLALWSMLMYEVYLGGWDQVEVAQIAVAIGATTLFGNWYQRRAEDD